MAGGGPVSHGGPRAVEPPGVRDILMRDFLPGPEGEGDYSALLLSFVRCVSARLQR